MTYNSEATLKYLEATSSMEGWKSWLIVRDWIRDMVVIEPKIMRKVSNARFGHLGRWLDQGAGNIGACGCLVGTTALELVKDRNHFKANTFIGEFDCVKPIGSFVPDFNSSVEAYEVVDVLRAESRKKMEYDAMDAGVAASQLGYDLGQPRAVALIRSEIRKQLLIRAKRIRSAKKAARLATRDKKTGQFTKVA